MVFGININITLIFLENIRQLCFDIF
ncbi:hypothetical protein E3V08_04025 [Candidatus Atribacteria bacterium MT.SAG.1]|nr:hypothetical protein E3V08_04025 [Candidatus Atribacteria bacterium MT.SAG.1]